MNSQLHHQREMEMRLQKFDKECVAAVHHIGLLQEQARFFLKRLSCEARDFKNLFLEYTKKLDLFTYAVTEFNMAASALENGNSTKTDPYQPETLKHGHIGISSSHSNTQQPTKDGMSNKRDRDRSKNKMENYMREVNLDPREQNEVISNTECAPVSLPPQSKLDPETAYEASIVAVDGSQLWVVVDDEALFKLVEDMNDYYKNVKMVEDYVPEIICAYYDESDTKVFLRALYITSEEGDPEVFLVDTGEFQSALNSRLYPLAPQFALTPPLAHLFSLAGAKQTEDKNVEDKQTEFLKQFLGKRYKMKIIADSDNNQMQCHVFLEDGTTLNELLERTLSSSDPEFNNNFEIIKIDENNDNENVNVQVMNSKTNDNDINENNDDGTIVNEISDGNDKKVEDDDRLEEVNLENMNLDEVLDYSKCPEYENVVEAVTGYSNRDEIDICKHYKDDGGCFKGSLCKKRHVKIHPDGWTLDRVPVTVKCAPGLLPAPGTRHQLRVTHVDDTCLFYVQFQCPEEPMTLAELIEEMTLDAEHSRPLPLEPAPGELVSARFTDGRYYRGRVVAVDNTVEVMYIDYGNTAFVSPSELRSVQPRWLATPVRAVPSRLAGVPGRSDPEVLRQLILDRTMEALIIARGYDELILKLVDADGFDVGEQLAAFAGVALQPYAVELDADWRCHHAPA